MIKFVCVVVVKRGYRLHARFGPFPHTWIVHGEMGQVGWLVATPFYPLLSRSYARLSHFQATSEEAGSRSYARISTLSVLYQHPHHRADCRPSARHFNANLLRNLLNDLSLFAYGRLKILHSLRGALIAKTMKSKQFFWSFKALIVR